MWTGLLRVQGRRVTGVALCRDAAGNYVGASALVIQHISEPSSLEALACREGLALAADLELNQWRLLRTILGW